MLTFEPFDGGLIEWGRILDTLPDRQVFQTPAWIGFLAESQHAEPVLAVLRDGNHVAGYFAGLIVRKAGLRILGSPFIGWGTDQMGIRLIGDTTKRAAVEALMRYAFGPLRCVHMEIVDHGLVPDELAGLGFEHSVSSGYEVDLTPDEEHLFENLSAKSCRYSIRKAAKMGVVVEEAQDDQFVDDYFAQLQQVFAKQSLVPTYDRERVRLLVNHLRPTGYLLLLRAKDPGGRCIATGMFLGMNTDSYFWGNASWSQDQRFCPNESIHWYAMRYWKNRGCQNYNLCGGGDYKRKYGGRRLDRFELRKSKTLWIARVRSLAYWGFRMKQRIMGFAKRRVPARTAEED